MEHKVLDHGFVRLDDSMADDLSVVNSARVSFAKRSEYEKGPIKYLFGPVATYEYVRLKEEDAGLIRFLMKNRHGTPFEHNSFRFHVKAPIVVFREWQRHRIGSFNEMSGRYTELKPEFYLPQPEQVRAQVGKPGAYTFEPFDDADKVEDVRWILRDAYSDAWDTYQNLLNEAVAKEQARLCLPVAIYSEMYWTVNARSLMNFLSLRNSDHAMYEIREYAKVVEEIFKEKMPVTAEAFIENGRVAP